jgi:sec-independent protein translocase protein TatA
MAEDFSPESSSLVISSSPYLFSPMRPQNMLALLPNLGPMELIIVGGIALLIFGNRLPSVARSVGKSLVEFKKGMNEIEEEVKQAGSVEAKDSANSETKV